MEVRKGYKQSEVGVIPEDWKIKILRDLSTLITKGTTPKKFSDSGINYIKIECLDGDKINIEKCLYIDDNTNKTELKRSILNEGDLLFAIAGATIGKCTFITNEIIPANTNQALSIIRLKDEENKMFVFYNLKSAAMQKYIIDNIAGGAQPNLNLEQIGNFCLPLPPTKSEQTAIATVLSDADALITSLEKLIEKKRAIKQGAMQELLNPKEGWEVKRLGEIADILTGFPFPSSGYSKTGIRLLRGSNIKRGNTDWNENICQYWPRVTAELLRYQLNYGDIVVAMDGSLVGKSFAQLSQLDLPGILLQRVARIRSTVIDINYLKELVCSEMFTGYCDSVKTSSAIPHISPADICNYNIRYPLEKSEQTRIASILSDMDVEITALEQKLGKYKLIKQGMMQELLTGKIRLNQDLQD